MSRKSACAVELTDCVESLPFTKIPGQSRLFLDFLADSPKLKNFYPEKNRALNDFAGTVLESYKVERETLCDILAETNREFGAGEKTFENIELLRQKETVAVVTGQQAGIFSGALYTIYKALAAVKLADDLRKQNVKAVPVFWIAEEDHDFEEIKKTFVLGQSSEAATSNGTDLLEVENEPENISENLPVGFIRLDQTINGTIGDLFDQITHTEFTDSVKLLLNETYKPGEAFSTAFAKFLAKLLREYGIIFLAPLDKRLKKLCAPIFTKAIEKSDEITAALLQKNEELAKENYHAQVLVEENSFPFFWLNEAGERKALRRDLKNSTIKVQDSKLSFTKNELLKIAENEPHNLSPNALLRPVVQDYLLPTVLYFGGAAEIAYFAQNSAVYKVLDRPITPIRHRASFTIVEAKHRRTLNRYELKFEDLFSGEEKIRAEVVEKFLSNGTAREFAEVEEIINKQLNRLDRKLLEDAPTLSDNLANRRRKILWHIGALRKKYHRAEIFKHKTAKRRLDTLFTAILPKDALQERTLNVITFLNLYGDNFIDWLYEAIENEKSEHQIFYL